jgi:hypothetical protein
MHATRSTGTLNPIPASPETAGAISWNKLSDECGSGVYYEGPAHECVGVKLRLGFRENPACLQQAQFSVGLPGSDGQQGEGQSREVQPMAANLWQETQGCRTA